ncbi:MAG: glycosyltransferase family A protein [Xanthobacteraceae bacterium]|jgi:glycosyltransferase involved in cell wall biosynthesis
MSDLAAMSSPRFTVLLTVHRQPLLLPFAMESVLWQSHSNFELFVVCDGAPAEAAGCARAFAARDPRVRVFDFEKGERRGERHRDTALALASGEFVAQLADDDIWFPEHLKELAALLADVEFGNLLLMGMAPDGSPLYFPGDLADPDTRQRLMSEQWNFFGPSVAGYRLSTYRRMPEGWAPAPPDIWSDLHMWRKFLRLDGITAASRFTIQSLCLHNAHRANMTLEQRRDETERWMNVIRDPAERAAMVERYWGGFAKFHVPLHGRLLAREQELHALRLKATDLDHKIAELQGVLSEKQAAVESLQRQCETLASGDAWHAALIRRLEIPGAPRHVRAGLAVARLLRRMRLVSSPAERIMRRWRHR